MPAILYGSEAWCLKESEMGISQRTERSMVRGVVYRSYVSPAILYGSGAWCLIESDMGISQRSCI